MKQAEMTCYVVQIRSKLDDGSYTSKDAYNAIWNKESPLTYEDRMKVHQTLELPYEPPNELELLILETVAPE